MHAVRRSLTKQQVVTHRLGSRMASTSVRVPRVAVVQLDSRHADVQGNLARVERLVDGSQASQPKLRKGEVDLLILPETALTGYIFDNLKEIEPLLETPHSATPGPTLTLARSLATRFGTYVLAGLPALLPFTPSASKASVPFDARPDEAQRTVSLAPAEAAELHPFNAALLVSPAGELLHTFRKHFLYENDKTWAQAGPGFEFIDLHVFGRLAVGICMDLNPWEFEAGFEAFELARFCRANKIDVLALPQAWLRPETPGPNADEPYHGLVNYWLTRATPLLASVEKPTLVVYANRTGEERGTTFGGSSTAFLVKPDGSVQSESVGKGEQLLYFKPT